MFPEQILQSLPENYADVSCNFDEMPAGLVVGIVIPSYGRDRYLRRCLSSLGSCDLSRAILCVVDETDADLVVDELSGFTCLYNVDSPYGDIARVSADMSSIHRQARATPGCVAFNALGRLKERVCAASKLRQMEHGCFRFFIRDDVFDSDPGYRKYISPKQSTKTTNRQLINDFHPDAPVIRLLKTQHAGVHDSLQQGWSLLDDLFNVRYLCSFDSDMIAHADWLQILIRAHESATAANRGRPIVASAFNASNHPVSAAFDGYMVKESAGGANTLFTREVYRDIVKSTLNSLAWDWGLVEKIHEKSGLIISTPDSRVQHIGARGMWSRPINFSRALDF